jgi:hypothetical protein
METIKAKFVAFWAYLKTLVTGIEPQKPEPPKSASRRNAPVRKVVKK